MALKKTIDYKGADAEYWRINKFSYDDVNDTAIVDLWLYINEVSKNEDVAGNGLQRKVLNLSDIKNVEIPAELSEITSPRDLLKTLLYQKIKEPIMQTDPETGEEVNVNWFSDAEDV